MSQMKFKVFRGDNQGGAEQEYTVEVSPGMVVLDAIHYIQGTQAPDLAVRWNCKAAKCGSCSAEVNGKPRLMCKTRLDDYDPNEAITVYPMKAFPVIKDLVCDVSWNYRNYKKLPKFTPAPDTKWIMQQEDVDRVQEFRKCIQCFLCQDVCHVIRNHDKQDFIGPAFLVALAGLEMHPLDTGNRLQFIKDEAKIGYCNITKCCTEVCPEDIHITDNAIIPLKERIVSEYYDPLAMIWRKVTGK